MGKTVEILKILPDDHISLHTPCDFPVDENDYRSSSFQSQVTEMVALMRGAQGIGLAANQVGLRKRFFVAFFGNRYLACYNPSWKPAPTAKIEITPEACLSLMVEKGVPRWTEIIATWSNDDGSQSIEVLGGIEAQCFQHECDHLDGIPFSEMPSKIITSKNQ